MDSLLFPSRKTPFSFLFDDDDDDTQLMMTTHTLILYTQRSPVIQIQKETKTLSCNVQQSLICLLEMENGIKSAATRNSREHAYLVDCIIK